MRLILVHLTILSISALTSSATSSQRDYYAHINDPSLNESLLQSVETERDNYYSPESDIEHPDAYQWQPYQGRKSKLIRKEYYPPRLPERIDPDVILPIDLTPDGTVDTPPRKFYAKVFPWKKIQLRIAMKYNDFLEKIIADPNHEEGRLYNKATHELALLQEEGREIDKHIKSYYIDTGCHKPYLEPLTDPLKAPHIPSRFGKESVAERAKWQAYNLNSDGRSFNFYMP